MLFVWMTVGITSALDVHPEITDAMGILGAAGIKGKVEGEIQSHTKTTKGGRNTAANIKFSADFQAGTKSNPSVTSVNADDGVSTSQKGHYVDDILKDKSEKDKELEAKLYYVSKPIRKDGNMVVTLGVHVDDLSEFTKQFDIGMLFIDEARKTFSFSVNSPDEYKSDPTMFEVTIPIPANARFVRFVAMLKDTINSEGEFIAEKFSIDSETGEFTEVEEDSKDNKGSKDDKSNKGNKDGKDGKDGKDDKGSKDGKDTDVDGKGNGKSTDDKDKTESTTPDSGVQETEVGENTGKGNKDNGTETSKN
ncbi:hypothetical protein ECANGB1_2630 [Enterospora canceri]|uniref:Uncharacterized protein n=1 Tax=Enterospora canceri TaxID=1081671 RepID=A0A1Y1S9C8_9MICR|nr:hypothetical protein ECANGB1_2630 [Enterospora canceri]